MNARFYIQGIGRFLTADTIIPGPTNPQAFNRYSYVLGNPLRLVDPSGHGQCVADQCTTASSEPSTQPFTSPFFKFVGDLTLAEKQMAHQAGSAIGQRIADTVNPIRRMEAIAEGTTYTPLSAENAFLGVFGRPITIMNVEEYLVDNGGFSVYAIASETETMITVGIERISNHYLFIHEIFHVFDLVILDDAANGALWDVQRQTENTANPFPNRPTLTARTDATYGFAGGNFSEWQKSRSGASGEEFADMGIGWTYNRWETDADGLTEAGNARANFMDANMAVWLYENLGP